MGASYTLVIPAAHETEWGAMREMLSARVEVEQVRRLSALAASRGISRSALLRQLVEDAVAAEQEVLAA